MHDWWKLVYKVSDFIFLAFITENSSLEPLLEGLLAHIHIDISWQVFGRNRTGDLRITQIIFFPHWWLSYNKLFYHPNLSSPALFSTEIWWRMHYQILQDPICRIHGHSRRKSDLEGVMLVRHTQVGVLLRSGWQHGQCAVVCRLLPFLELRCLQPKAAVVIRECTESVSNYTKDKMRQPFCKMCSSAVVH